MHWAPDVTSQTNSMPALYQSTFVKQAADEEDEEEAAMGEFGAHAVALFGGKSLRESDKQLLQRLYPDSEILWYGSDQDVGNGKLSAQGLLRKIKAGRVNTGERIAVFATQFKSTRGLGMMAMLNPAFCLPLADRCSLHPNQVQRPLCYGHGHGCVPFVWCALLHGWAWHQDHSATGAIPAALQRGCLGPCKAENKLYFQQ